MHGKADRSAGEVTREASADRHQRKCRPALANAVPCPPSAACSTPAYSMSAGNIYPDLGADFDPDIRTTIGATHDVRTGLRRTTAPDLRCAPRARQMTALLQRHLIQSQATHGGGAKDHLHPVPRRCPEAAKAGRRLPGYSGARRETRNALFEVTGSTR